MLFKVILISYGWFEVDFNRSCVLTNSHYLGCDAPGLLLEALGDLLENKTNDAWLCWQDEPGAYILNLEKQGEKLIVRVYGTDKESMELEHSGASLKEHIAECIYKAEEDFAESVENILDEFALYENGTGRNRYQEHWGDFPNAAYDRARKFLQS